MCVCGGGGIVLCNLLALIPGPLAKAMPIAQRGTVGVATHHVLCSSHSDVQKPVTLRWLSLCLSTSLQPIVLAHMDLSMSSHAQELAAGTLGSLSEQSAQLRAVLHTMKSNSMDLRAIPGSHWPSSEVSSVCNSTILHSGSPSSHTHGVAVILSPRAKSAWEAAGCVFQPVSERILRLRLKCHMSLHDCCGCVCSH